jgi:hypothetical protein
MAWDFVKNSDNFSFLAGRFSVIGLLGELVGW